MIVHHVKMNDVGAGFDHGRNLFPKAGKVGRQDACLLYTSDAADERSSVDLGGRRIIKKKKYIRMD